MIIMIESIGLVVMVFILLIRFGIFSIWKEIEVSQANLIWKKQIPIHSYTAWLVSLNILAMGVRISYRHLIQTTDASSVGYTLKLLIFFSFFFFSFVQIFFSSLKQSIGGLQNQQKRSNIRKKLAIFQRKVVGTPSLLV